MWGVPDIKLVSSSGLSSSGQHVDRSASSWSLSEASSSESESKCWSQRSRRSPGESNGICSSCHESAAYSVCFWSTQRTFCLEQVRPTWQANVTSKAEAPLSTAIILGVYAGWERRHCVPLLPGCRQNFLESGLHEPRWTIQRRDALSLPKRSYHTALQSSSNDLSSWAWSNLTLLDCRQRWWWFFRTNHTSTYFLPGICLVDCNLACAKHDSWTAASFACVSMLSSFGDSPPIPATLSGTEDCDGLSKPSRASIMENVSARKRSGASKLEHMSCQQLIWPSRCHPVLTRWWRVSRQRCTWKWSHSFWPSWNRLTSTVSQKVTWFGRLFKSCVAFSTERREHIELALRRGAPSSPTGSSTLCSRAEICLSSGVPLQLWEKHRLTAWKIPVEPWWTVLSCPLTHCPWRRSVLVPSRRLRSKLSCPACLGSCWSRPEMGPGCPADPLEPGKVLSPAFAWKPRSSRLLAGVILEADCCKSPSTLLGSIRTFVHDIWSCRKCAA